MSEHPVYQRTLTYIAERKRETNDEWIEVVRFTTLEHAVEYVRNNSPAWSPWRIVRLRTETASEVLQEQPTTTEDVAR